MASQFEISPPPPKKHFILKVYVEAHWAKRLVSVGQTFIRGGNVTLVTIVTIDLHKSKLYVKKKHKFSKDINCSASKVACLLLMLSELKLH